MAKQRKDLTGQRFGMLKVIKEAGRNKHKAVLWLCQCDCGNNHIVTTGHLEWGDVESCGCQKQRFKPGNTIGPRFQPGNRIVGHRFDSGSKNPCYKHGQKNTRLYRIWNEMKQRCNNPNRPKHKIYGARGITVCDEWQKDFVAFRDWALANGYRDDLTIDRKDNDGNYEPGNCRWATYTEQNNNRHLRRKVE